MGFEPGLVNVVVLFLGVFFSESVMCPFGAESAVNSVRAASRDNITFHIHSGHKLTDTLKLTTLDIST